MIYTITYSQNAINGIKKLKKSNPAAFKKIQDIATELANHPKIGTGHPEPLRGGGGLTWSRRISKKDRIIYDIFDDKVLVNIVQVGNHYDDK